MNYTRNLEKQALFISRYGQKLYDIQECEDFLHKLETKRYFQRMDTPLDPHEYLRDDKLTFPKEQIDDDD